MLMMINREGLFCAGVIDTLTGTVMDHDKDIQSHIGNRSQKCLPKTLVFRFRISVFKHSGVISQRLPCRMAVTTQCRPLQQTFRCKHDG